MEEIIKERILSYVGKPYYSLVELKFVDGDLEIRASSTFYGIELFLDVTKVFYKLNYVTIKDNQIILRCYN